MWRRREAQAGGSVELTTEEPPIYPPIERPSGLPMPFVASDDDTYRIQLSRHFEMAYKNSPHYIASDPIKAQNTAGGSDASVVKLTEAHMNVLYPKELFQSRRRASKARQEQGESKLDDRFLDYSTYRMRPRTASAVDIGAPPDDDAPSAAKDPLTRKRGRVASTAQDSDSSDGHTVAPKRRGSGTRGLRRLRRAPSGTGAGPDDAINVEAEPPAAGEGPPLGDEAGAGTTESHPASRLSLDAEKEEGDEDPLGADRDDAEGEGDDELGGDDYTTNYFDDDEGGGAGGLNEEEGGADVDEGYF